METMQSWPEPVVRVQSLSESGITAIPDRYIKPPPHRPSLPTTESSPENIPIIDFENAFSENEEIRLETLSKISEAARQWGFFQIVNHGICDELLRKVMNVWREFFKLPLEVKQEYANNPETYEGYGSRLGVEKDAILDWSDYFFLHFLPSRLPNINISPSLPASCREMTHEYGSEMAKLSKKLLKVLSTNLGLEEGYLQKAFGGEEIGGCLRVTIYPKCPQPDLTLGLSSHSDPGGLTILFADEDVSGLQIRRGHNWITVTPVPNAFIINIGDQIQVLSNCIYKSVEHRVIVNSSKERLSLAFFYNPDGDVAIEPANKLLSVDCPALYPPMTFNEYRLSIRRTGPRGKTLK